MSDLELDHALAAARPELVVTTLLQHALGATRNVLAGVHPELRSDDLDLADADHDTHLALLIAVHVVDLDKLLGQYRHTVESAWRSCDGQIPF